MSVRLIGRIVPWAVLLASGCLVWLVIFGPRPPRPVIPFDVDVPAGGTVIYQAEKSRIGFYGYPVRIVELSEQCVVEVYEDSAWTFASSGLCAAVVPQ